MKAVVQRVKESFVTFEGDVIGAIGEGLLIFLGVSDEDSEKDADFLAEKIPNLRIFEDENAKLNLSLLDTGGQMLVVSQFTLLGDCRKGRRPSFVKAAGPEKARKLYRYFVERIRKNEITVETGRFGTLMAVSLVNHGPVTLIVES